MDSLDGWVHCCFALSRNQGNKSMIIVMSSNCIVTHLTSTPSTVTARLLLPDTSVQISTYDLQDLRFGL